MVQKWFPWIYISLVSKCYDISLNIWWTIPCSHRETAQQDATKSLCETSDYIKFYLPIIFQVVYVACLLQSYSSLLNNFKWSSSEDTTGNIYFYYVRITITEGRIMQKLYKNRSDIIAIYKNEGFFFLVMKKLAKKKSNS